MAGNSRLFALERRICQQALCVSFFQLFDGRLTQRYGLVLMEQHTIIDFQASTISTLSFNYNAHNDNYKDWILQCTCELSVGIVMFISVFQQKIPSLCQAHHALQ